MKGGGSILVLAAIGVGAYFILAKNVTASSIPTGSASTFLCPNGYGWDGTQCVSVTSTGYCQPGTPGCSFVGPPVSITYPAGPTTPPALTGLSGGWWNV